MLDGYDDFNTYTVVGSLGATTNLERSGILCYLMTLEASIVVSRLYHNNKNTTLLSTLFVPYLHESYKQVLYQIEQLQQVRIIIFCEPNDQNQLFLQGYTILHVLCVLFY